MNENLGRDRVWNDQTWSEIDKAVREEVGRIRVAQKVCPATGVNDLLPGSTTLAVPPGPGADQFQPFLEISREFVLTQAQVDSEENAHLGLSFARSAASAIAAAEDTLLFLGTPGTIPALVGAMGATVTNPHAIPSGFVAQATNHPFITIVGAGAGSVGNILVAVAASMAALNNRAQPGPFALFLSPTRYAQTFNPGGPGLLQGPGDQINRVVTGGFYMVNSLAAPLQPPPVDIGILVSLGGEPAKIILGTDTTASCTFTDAQGHYHFRVFERFQLVVRDGRAFQKLVF